MYTESVRERGGKCVCVCARDRIIYISNDNEKRRLSSIYKVCDIGASVIRNENEMHENRRRGESTEILDMSEIRKKTPNKWKLMQNVMCCKCCQRLNCNQKMRKIHHEEQFNLSLKISPQVFGGQIYGVWFCQRQKPPKLWTQAIGRNGKPDLRIEHNNRKKNKWNIVCQIQFHLLRSHTFIHTYIHTYIFAIIYRTL